MLFYVCSPENELCLFQTMAFLCSIPWVSAPRLFHAQDLRGGINGVRIHSPKHSLSSSMAFIDIETPCSGDITSFNLVVKQYWLFTLLAAMFVFFKSKSFPTCTMVTANSVHALVLASAIVFLTFILVCQKNKTECHHYDAVHKMGRFNPQTDQL